MNMENDGFIVIEGIHKNPNNIDTIDEKTKKIHGPFKKKQAEIFAKSLIQKTLIIFTIELGLLRKDWKLMMYVKNVKKRKKVLNKI